MTDSTSALRYNTLSAYFRARFGRRVRKIPLDAGFSCPNRDGTLSRGGCVFCNEVGSGTGLADGLGLAGQWAHWRERFRAGPDDLFMAYLQSYSNTHGPADKVRDALEKLTALDGLAGISLGTRPDCLDPEKFDLLGRAANTVGEFHLELGLQSADDATLKRINRGHTAADFANACREAHARGLKVVAHVIAGLPGEGLDHLLTTVDFLNALPIHGIKLHNLYVCENTGMETLWKNGTYTPLERTDYVDWVCRALARLRPDVVVHRLASDPADGELLAPDWAADKRSVLDDIRKRMGTFDLRQGLQYIQTEAQQKYS